MSKIHLATAIRQRLSKLKMSQNQLAQEAGVNVSSLGRWLNKNEFPARQWPSVAKVLGLDEDWRTVQNDYQVKEVVRAIARKSTELPTLTELYAEMQLGDLYAFHSLNLTPLEFRNTALKQLIAEGIKNGAFYLYVFISDKTIDNFSKRYNTQSLKTASEMIRKFGTFLDDLHCFGVERSQADDHVKAVVIDSSPFTMHRETLGGFWLSSDEGNGVWVTQRLATGNISEPARTLSRDDAFTDDFERFIGVVYPDGDTRLLPSVVQRLRKVSLSTSGKKNG